MVKFPRSKAWRVSIVVVPLIVIMGIYNAKKPHRVVEPRLFGSWVDREGTKVEFWKDGTFLITCEGQQNFPVKWWVDDQSTLHALHPDEDASGWVSVPYRITGNDQLHLENSNFFKLPRELKRIGQ